MLAHYRWSPISVRRNEITAVYEPVQPFVLHAFADELRDAVFFDIGANIGVYSILFADHPSIASVQAYEPMPDCCTEIKENVRLNGFGDRIEISRVALSSERGSAAFRCLAPLSGGNGLADTHLFEENAGTLIEVQTERLDARVSFRDRHIVLKIDVEGHEKGVLEGARDLIRHNTGVMQVELHAESPNRDAVVAMLAECGWSPVFQVGWDHYFSNLPTFQTPEAVLERVQTGLTRLVDYSKSAPQPARRRIARGLIIELSRERVDSIKLLLAKAGLFKNYHSRAL